MIKKTLSMILLVALIGSAMSGCKSNKGDQTSGQVSKSDAKKYKISIVIPTDDVDVPFSSRYATKQIEKKFNVQLVPIIASDDKVKLLLATNTIPDLVPNMWSNNVAQYSDLFMDLTPVITTKLPNVVKSLASLPKQAWSAKYNGKYYTVPNLVMNRIPQMGWMANQTLLDKIGGKIPDTFEELYTMCKKYKALYPDQYPLGGGETINALRVGYLQDNDFDDKLDKFIVPYTKPIMKDYLAFVAKLYAEKLIDPEFVTNGDKNLKSDILGEKRLFWVNWWLSTSEQPGGDYGDKNFKDNIVGLLPPKNTSGRRSQPMWQGDVVGNGTVVNKEVQKDQGKLDRVLEILNWLYSDEGINTTVYGEKGVSYTVNAKGEKQFTDNYKYATAYPKATDKKFDVKYYTTMAFNSVDDSWTMRQSPQVQDIVKKMQSTPFSEMFRGTQLPGTIISAETTNKISALENDCNPYANAQETQIIMGKKPVSSWDQVLTTLKAKGVDQIGELKTKGYEEWKKTADYNAWKTAN